MGPLVLKPELIIVPETPRSFQNAYKLILI